MPRSQGQYDQLGTRNSIRVDYDALPTSEAYQSAFPPDHRETRASHWGAHASGSNPEYAKRHSAMDRKRKLQEAKQPLARPMRGGMNDSLFGRFKSFLSSYAFEGRKSLRALSCGGGIACTIASIWAVTNIQQLLLDIPTLILLIYQIIFGITVTIVESKTEAFSENVLPWVRIWFPFLLEPWGKGFFVILIGVLGISLWQKFFYVACAGAFMTFIGLLYLIASCGGHQGLNRVGIELTQHPARGNYQQIPRLGQHRSKEISKYDSPQFGDDEYTNYQPNMDTNVGDLWTESNVNKYPAEFVHGFGQHQRQMRQASHMY